MCSLNNEEVGFWDQEKIFARKREGVVQGYRLLEVTLQTNHLTRISSIRSNDRWTYYLDQDSQNLDRQEQNQIPPNYCNGNKLTHPEAKRKLL